MDTETEPTRHETKTTRSERELVVTRTFDGPARLVFEAWTKPELIMRWWAPKSFGITFISCEADVRTGGTYRFVFGAPQFDQPMAFVGRYLEVVPNQRIVWTNDETDDGHTTTLTLEERGGKTFLTLRDLFPSVEALDTEMESGAAGGYPEQFDALDDLLRTLA